MRILITIGMIIVFVSVFFILLTGNTMLKNAFNCTEEDGRTICTFRGLMGPPAFGIFIIAFFVMIDILTVYLIVTNIK
jgi:hypothetical protein